MRKYQRNRVQITGNPTQQRESEKRERVLEALSSVVAKLGGGNTIPPALQVISAINPPPASSAIFWVLAGQPGGQVGLGGTSTGQSATIGSNPQRDGKVFFGSAQQTAYDETNERLGINSPSPAARLHIRHSVDGGSIPLLRFDTPSGTNDINYGSDGASGIDLILTGTPALRISDGALRLGSFFTTARIEAGSSVQTNMNLVLSGTRAIQGTLMTIDFASVLLKGTLRLEDPAAGTNAITIQAPAAPTVHTLTLPGALVANGILQMNAGATGVLQWNAVTGDASLGAAGVLTFANVNSNIGTFGNSTNVGQFTVNAKGLITAAVDVPISAAAVGAAPLAGAYIMIGNDAALPNERALTGTARVSVTDAGAGSTVTIDAVGAALTRVSDTNVILTLGGSPTTALVNATSLTLSWSGQLAPGRGGTGINASNITDLFNQLDPLVARGDLITHNGTNSVGLVIGPAASLLQVNGTSDPAWVALSGDATIAVGGALALINVNSNIGSFGTATQVGQFTVNAKGLITAAVNVPITYPGGMTGFAAPTVDVNVTAEDGGIATTALRSDARLQLSLGIIPSWTGQHTFSVSPRITPFTAGSILFAGASDEIAQDNANLFWNTSLGRLGILTASPSVTLHVSSSTTGAIQAFFANTNAGTGAFAEVAAQNAASANAGLRMLAMSTGFTTSGAYVQNAGVLEAGSLLAGGLSIAAKHASGDIRFYSGGHNLRGTIAAAGATTWATAHTFNALVTAPSGIDFVTAKAIAMACDNGPTLPTTPTAGQWFRHITTGRDILMQSDGTNWSAMAGFTAITFYVSPTGTDSPANGTASGTSAFRQVQYAFNSIPWLFNGNIIINVAAGSYTAAILGAKFAVGAYTITINGNNVYTGAAETITGHGATGAVNGGATAQDVIGAAAGTPWTVPGVNGYRDKIIHIVGTTGGGSSSNIDVYRVIESNTTSTITLAGGQTLMGRVVEATDTITIMPVSSAAEATIIGSSADTTVSALLIDATMMPAQPISLNDIRLDNGTTASIGRGCLTIAAGLVTATRCYMNGGRVSVRANNGAVFNSLESCALIPNKASSIAIYATNKAAQFDVYGCLLRNAGSGSTGGIFAAGLQTINVMFGTVVTGFTAGISSGAFSVSGAIVVLHSSSRHTFFKSNTTDLVRAKGTLILLNTTASFTTETVAADIAYKKNKTLTDNTLTDLFTCTVANNTVVFVDINYEVEVFNGTDLQIMNGQLRVRLYKKGAAAVIASVVNSPASLHASSGTLGVSFQPKSGAEATIQVTADSSLATPVDVIRYTVNDYTEQGVTLL